MKEDIKIIIDKQAAVAFLHQSAHLDWHWVPDDIKKMKLTLKTGQETTIGGLIEQAKERVDVLTNYIKLAIET